MLKKHFLLLPEIIPGQIEIIPTESPKINIGIILKQKVFRNFFPFHIKKDFVDLIFYNTH